MTNTDKLALICIAVSILGFIIIIIDVQRHAYNKGFRQGYHRGRSVSRQEFWQE